NARVKPPGGAAGALPTTTEPSAETPWAELPPPKSPRSCIPAAVQRKACGHPFWQLAVSAAPTTTDPSADVAVGHGGLPPSVPRFCSTPATHRKARGRNVFVS